MTNPKTETFDQLVAAAGNFLDELAERARREQPAVHVAIDAALQSGESYTKLTVKLLPGGIQIRASICGISDGAEQAILDDVSGVMTGPMQ